jgi:hypothetical protein
MTQVCGAGKQASSPVSFDRGTGRLALRDDQLQQWDLAHARLVQNPAPRLDHPLYDLHLGILL